MEGNLNRARSSLYIASPPAGSLPSDNSTPSPKTPIRSATASSRYHDPSPGSPIHSRMVSDGSVPMNGVLPTNFPQRSASALGAAGGYRKPQLNGSESAERISEIQDSLSGGYHRAGLNKPVDIVLERLDEVEGPDDTEILPSENRSSAQLETFLSPTFGTVNGEKGLIRSASVAQMRDLKDQMKGLKGKISTLREQARADSLKRRSLQSLRTPSPFTHSQVDQWYAEPQASQSSESSGNGSPGQNAWNDEQKPPSVDENQAIESGERVAVDRNVVTPPLRSDGSPAESARLSHSTGSGSSGALQSKRNPPTALEADQTDEESVMGGYEDVEDGMMTKLSYSGPPRQLTESPVLGDARPNSPGETTPADDDSDDMQTENGDFSDDGEPKQLEDVFIDTAETESGSRQKETTGDDAYDVEEDESLDTPTQQQFRQEDGGYDSESGESLYHDTLQHPISHEDREDAFDYEHFILHSALGTISQQRLARSGSFSSEDSVETTRGPVSSDNNTNNTDKNNNDTSFPSPTRRTSMSSISTVESADSFATATEGRSSRNNRLSSESEEVIFNHANRAAAAAAKDRPDSLLLAKAAAATGHIPSTDDSIVSNTKRNSAEEPRQTQQPPMTRRPASSAAMPGHRPSISSFESTGTTRSFPLVNRNRLGSISTTAGAGTANSIRSSSGTHSLSSSISVPISSSSNAATPTQGRISSDNEELRSISETLMNETASICEQANASANSETDTQGNPRRPSSLDSKRSVSSLGQSFHERTGSSGGVAGGMASHAQALQALSKEDQYLVERLVGNLGRCVLGLSESGRASTESRAFRRRIDAARRILEGLDPV